MERCQSCGNADQEQPDGTCGHCGGPFRRVGRPREGDVRVTATIPRSMLDDIDAFAEQQEVPRAEAIRRLLAAGLSSPT